MNILITNDDGIGTEGIKKLAETAAHFGNVYVVAPLCQMSGKSHGFTYDSDVIVRDYDIGIDGVKAYTCSGTPADCVRIGAIKVLPEKPDYVFSGINTGYNISHDIQYSATVGAVLEGAFLGIHSVAFSQGSVEYMEVVDAYLKEIMEECMSKPLDYNAAWNVNFPKCSLHELKGILRDRTVSTDPFYNDDYNEKVMDDGSIAYSIIQDRVWKGSDGTDLAAVADNYISIGIVRNIR